MSEQITGLSQRRLFVSKAKFAVWRFEDKILSAVLCATATGETQFCPERHVSSISFFESANIRKRKKGMLGAFDMKHVYSCGRSFSDSFGFLSLRNAQTIGPTALAEYEPVF